MVIAVDEEKLEALTRLTSKKTYKPRYKMIFPQRTEREKALIAKKLMVASLQYQIMARSNEG